MACEHATWTPTWTVQPHPHPLGHAAELHTYQVEVQFACDTCHAMLTYSLPPASDLLYQDVAVLADGQTVRLSGRVVAEEPEGA